MWQCRLDSVGHEEDDGGIGQGMSVFELGLFGVSVVDVDRTSRDDLCACEGFAEEFGVIRFGGDDRAAALE
ncbi:hypothetical protein N7468_000335 [Penicillium chermesinum]|uniref:Uncharacterized protein n=1 Tax=Penicillium chermesinum TaxID=63820 RepID=A0A9W9TYR2_9EURO|nr:uncharacterized protein N7468_000335 [Penicillium chermesinum]KAJ5248884.1 hypothetical protein N7468_000335 [Penicillium chermesinum]KAJ6150986.1 hypothetical protein N7470_007580 [Penicillium chermesinum]